ncbi:hypothetical protein ACS0TY_008941 [Phlomoides rotata]
MGFYHVARCGAMIIDSHLITALVEGWRPETHTFHFLNGEATVTLQDVAIIWGLNIDGEPLTIDEHHRTAEEWSWYCTEMLGFTPLDTDFKSKTRIKLSAISSHLLNIVISDDIDQETVDQYARGILAIQQTNHGNRLLQGPLEGANGRNLGPSPYGSRWNTHHSYVHSTRFSICVYRDIFDRINDREVVYEMESPEISTLDPRCITQNWMSKCPLIMMVIVELLHPNRVLR